MKLLEFILKSMEHPQSPLFRDTRSNQWCKLLCNSTQKNTKQCTSTKTSSQAPRKIYIPYHCFSVRPQNHSALLCYVHFLRAKTHIPRCFILTKAYSTENIKKVNHNITWNTYLLCLSFFLLSEKTTTSSKSGKLYKTEPYCVKFHTFATTQTVSTRTCKTGHT